MTDPTQYLPAHEGPLALLVLFASSVIEYLFPPFPGDTVTLFGAFLVAARGWSFGSVLAATTLGSGVGAMIDYGLGVLAARRRGRLTRQLKVAGKNAEKLDWLMNKLRRHGAWFIALNRFLPGVRAFFFLAAGMAGMKPGPVAFFALLSALAFNLLVLFAGMGLGASWPRLYALFVTYTQVAWVVLGAGALVGIFFALRSYRRRRAAPLAPAVEPPPTRPMN